MMWMIHEVTQKDLTKISKLPRNDILFWDDAVLSQYEAILSLKQYRHFVAVSTNICNHASKNWNSSKCVWYEQTSLSHQKWHQTEDSSAFMTWEHIRKLNSLENVEIVSHGYNHTHLDTVLPRGVTSLRDECLKIKQDFINNLSFVPKMYVYPYNEKTFWSDSVIKKYLCWYTIGSERTDIKTIL